MGLTDAGALVVPEAASAVGGIGSRRTRKRVLVVSVTALCILGAAMTTSFLGNTGTTTATVTNGTTTLLYPISSALTGAPSSVTSLKYTPSSGIVSGATTGAVLPAWSPSANSSGSVTSGGDLALVDATTARNGISVNMYITNLPALQQDYNSFALPVNVYSSTCASSSCTWSQATAVVASPPVYITSTTGYLSFNLPKGYYYDITLDSGGSYYCVSTSASGGALAPTFYFTAQSY